MEDTLTKFADDTKLGGYLLVWSRAELPVRGTWTAGRNGWTRT